jgi:hypothetical protein
MEKSLNSPKNRTRFRPLSRPWTSRCAEMSRLHFSLLELTCCKFDIQVITQCESPCSIALVCLHLSRVTRAPYNRRPPLSSTFPPAIFLSPSNRRLTVGYFIVYAKKTCKPNEFDTRRFLMSLCSTALCYVSYSVGLSVYL